MALRELDGRTALVTGGTRGIGRATAHRLSAAGATVLLTGRKSADAEAAAADISASTGVPAVGLALDAADGASIDALMEHVGATYPNLDILVANAGILNVGPVGATPDAVVAELVQVNVLGSFAVLQGAARLMTARGSGSIVLISSLIAQRGIPGMAAYGTTKGAIESMALTAAAELGPQGIRVNVVAPGVIATDMIAPFPPESLEGTIAVTPLRRLGTPEDIASAVLFLAGDGAAFVTGHVLAVDGGLWR